MVERSMTLDSIFSSLADPTRRDILRRVSKQELSISALAKPYHMSFAAIAKHVNSLEVAKLVTKHRRGKHQMVSAVPKTIKIASKHLDAYEELWLARFNALDELLTQ